MKTFRPLLAALACAALVHPAFAEENKKPTEAEMAAAENAARDQAIKAAEANRKAAETAAAKLDVGSPAPVLKPAKWIQGEPVTAFEKDKTYVIECWATWCGPCVAAIPHVNALHSKFKDKGLVVIGVNVWEDPADKAEAFVKKKGDGMAYRVAYDGGQSGDIAKTWLTAAGVNGIPHAFVVRENKILWHGHPGELSEETVADMIAGKFDPNKAAGEASEKKKLVEEFGELQQKFQRLIAEKKTDEASKILERQIELAGKLMPEQAVLVKKGGAVEIALAQGDTKAALVRIREFAEAGLKIEGAIGAQFMAASQIVTDARLAGSRDYALALTCVDRLIAAEPEAAKAPQVTMLRARALDGVGKKDEALKLLTEIAAITEENPVRDDAKNAIDALKAGKSWPKDPVNPDAKDEPKPEAAKAEVK